MPQRTFALLGSLEITVDGQSVTAFGYDKVRALLAYLVLEARQPLRRDTIAEPLWPEQPHGVARNNLRRALVTLRKALADATGETPWLLATRDTLQVNPASDCTVDVTTFTSLVAACTAHRHPPGALCSDCIAWLTEAMELYRGDFLSGLEVRDSVLFAEWVTLWRERLHRQAVAALTQLMVAHEQRGDDAVEEFARRLLALQPWDEAAYCCLMRVYARRGQRGAVNAEYTRCQRALHEELGAEPDEATTLLYQQLLAESASQATVIAPAFPAAVRRSNLPTPLTSLIGREQEQYAVMAALQRDDVRLLTLTGPGGVGKTRLALAVAHALQHEFTDGVWFVDLASTREAAMVLAAIAQVVGVKEHGGLPLGESLQASLRDQHLLLLLDNFEQVASAGPHIVALLQAAAQLSVLVTSRVTLHLSGEHEVVVPTLALPDLQRLPPLDRLTQYAAIDLFLQRCKAAHADFQVTAATASAVAGICVRLDGLPLALELAAARIKLFSPATLLQRLDHRLALLTGGARDKEARHQTLRATIDWSYDLLDAVEQRLFARLGAFVGSWTIEAPEAVCSAPGNLPADVLDGLQALMDKSLVRQVEGVEGEPRFTMLETIRDYALERLDASDEAVAIRRASAAYFLSWVETAAPHLNGPLQMTYVKRLAADYENLRATHAWLLAQQEHDMLERLGVALSEFFFIANRPVQGLRWLEDVLAAKEEQGGRLRAQVLLGAADLAWAAGDRARARAYATTGVQICTELDDTRGRAWGLHVLGIVAREEYDVVTAAAWFTESLALFEELGDQHRIAWGYLNLGTVAFAQHDDKRGRALLEESLRRFRRVGNSFGLAGALEMLAEVAHAQGDRAYALHCMDESATYRSQGESRGGGWAVRWAAYRMWLDGKSAQAMVLLEQAVESYRAAGDTLSVALVLEALAWVMEDQGDHAGARAAGEECLQWWQQRGSSRSLKNVLVLLGHVANEEADYGRAHRHFVESLVLYRDEGMPRASAWSLVGVARAARGNGRSLNGDRRAARLLGAVELMADPLDPLYYTITIMNALRRCHYVREVAAARRGLDEIFAMEWAEGRAMTLEQAIAYALSDET